MTLKEAIESLRLQPVLINDGVDRWTVNNFLDALHEKGNEEYAQQDVYLAETYITILNEEGLQVTPHLFAIENIGETPYFVSHETKGYRVKLLLNHAQHYARYIYARNNCYEFKQAAYRKKDTLNELWQEFRILGA